MAEFKLGRIRFVWKDEWTAGSIYYKDDVIKVGGRTYICLVGHTANENFYTDLAFSPTRWELMGDGQSWKGDWNISTTYFERDIVRYGGILYICEEGHISASTLAEGLELDQAKWLSYSESFDWKDQWTTETRYKKNDIVRYGSFTYIATEGHTSAATESEGLELDQAKWDQISSGLEWKNIWTTATRYKTNDVVKYGSLTYVCITPHTSAATESEGLELDQAKWEKFGEGFEWKSDWEVDTRYVVNDLVTYGATTYVCLEGHTSAATYGIVDSTIDGLEADQNKWKEFSYGFDWKGDWTTETRYKKNDLVKYGSLTYVVNTGHTSAATESEGLELDQANWDLYGEGFDWKGDWTTETRYKKNDLVRYGSNTYVANTGHTSAATESEGLELDQAKWDQFNQGVDWNGDWTTETRYKKNDLVRYGGITYIANTGHTSAATESDGLELDQEKWDVYGEGFAWNSNWTTETRYKKNDLVRYGGYTYVCIEDHTSANTITDGLELDQEKWATFNPGIEYLGDWNKFSYRYKLNDVVKYGAGLWICINEHTSSTDSFESQEVNWNTFVTGFEFKEEWSSETTYIPGDVVRYGGNQYISLTNHVNSSPVLVNSIDWALYAEGIKFEADWSIETSYRVGDVVRVNGSSYLAIVNSESIQLSVTATTDIGNLITVSSTIGLVPEMIVKFTGTVFGNLEVNKFYYINTVVNGTQITISETISGPVFDVSTASGNITAFVSNHPIDSDFWELLSGGISWRNEWQADVEYDIGNAVRLGDNSYIAITKHRSSLTNSPDLDTQGDFWNVLSVGSEISALTTTGDILYFSGAGPTRLPIGEDGDVLVVKNGAPAWDLIGYVDHVYYVAPTGQNKPAPSNGLSLDKPWKSVRYAAEQVLKGARNPSAQKLLELNRIFVQREVTEWIQYQIDQNIGIFEGFVYNSTKCERDVGFILDRIISDIGQGGNLKIRAAAQTLLNVLSDGPFSTEEDENGTGEYANLSVEGPQSVLAYQYMLDLLNNVLRNEEPDVNYQQLNSVANEAVQFIDSTVVAEDSGIEEANNLLNVIITALDTQDPVNIPARIIPSNLIKISTGVYAETLPIIIPVNTCVIGEELRSTTVTASDSVIEGNDTFYTVSTFDHVASVVSDVVQGVSITPSTGNTEPQYIEWPLATSSEGTTVSNLIKVMQTQADWRTTSLNISRLTDPTPFDTGFFAARKLVKENTLFLADEVAAYLDNEYPDLRYSQTKTLRDATYIIQALIYDLTYGGNALSIQAGLAYFNAADGAQPLIPASIKAATLDSLTFLKTRLSQIAANTEIAEPLQSDTIQFIDLAAGSAGAITLIENNVDDIIDIIDNGPSVVGTTVTLVDPTPTNGVNTTTALITAYNTLDAAVDTITTDTITFINTNYPTLEYSEAKAIRDTEIVLKAVGYDFMFNSNYQTIKAAHAYLRESVSSVYSSKLLKDATRGSLDFARTQAIANVGSDTTAISRINELMQLVDLIIFGGSNEGSICQTETEANYHASLLLEKNRTFISAEIESYIAETYVGTVSEISSNVLVIDSTIWLRRNTAIVFSNTVFSGVQEDVVYYVHNVLNSIEFTIATTPDATEALQLPNGTGSMTVELSYNKELCVRDVETYIDALKYDLVFPGNYQSRYVARYYANAVVSSLEEDMFYLRDGSGARNMTLKGLNGDLTPPNSFGTSRVTAGAYASLDPGWGPDDFTVWILGRSPYVQNVTTFGNAAIGQKIDGALHAGGNDSIVSNDFTQIISDGIGAWVANNGRAELVSVFSYYAHIGYLSTEGGRIRGTNGNNSYGEFGSVAEGVDESEVPNKAVVDNKLQFVATVGSVLTNGDSMSTFEFENAGIEYTDTTWILTGGGFAAVVEQDEFRDNAVFQIRITESETVPFGGAGYINSRNTAQTGTLTSITIAAVDGELSTAYVGMKIYITAGPGVGQYAIIDTYNSASKEATLVRESDGQAGWDHVIPGTAIVSPGPTTVYSIEPSIEFTAPPFSSELTSLVDSISWSSVDYAEIFKTYIVTGTTSGIGTGVEFQVTKKGTKYESVQLRSAGEDYARLDTITILGTDLGGTSPANNLIITLTSVNTVTGSVIAFDFEGRGAGGIFVATGNSNNVNTAADGESWIRQSAALPAPGTWVSASGKLTNEVNAGNFVIGESYTIVDQGDTFWEGAGAIGGQNQPGDVFVATSAGVGSGTAQIIGVASVAVNTSGNQTAFSRDGGITWSSGGTLPFSNPSSVAYGQGRWIAVSSSGTTNAFSIDGGISWTAGGSLPTSTEWKDVVYGKGRWIAVSGETGQPAVVAYSSNGGLVWSTATLPAAVTSDAATLKSVAYGNNRFVAVADSSNSGTISIFSLDGVTWISSTLPASATWTAITYGQGVFLAVTSTSQSASSEDGIVWQSRTVNAGANGHSSIAFGNPNQQGMFVAIDGGTGISAAKVLAGARTRARPQVADGQVFLILITEPGSNYNSAPTMTITDPSSVIEVQVDVRIGKGSLATPSFVNRGTQYVTGSAQIDEGNGYADNFQTGGFVTVRRLTDSPVAGSNLVFDHLPTKTFKIVNVVSLRGDNDGSYTASFQISPQLSIAESPNDETEISTRIRYSQVRLTGHDFLDIGTGGFESTNYPNLPEILPNPANETFESNGGRVFFTSTDQDGNFRVGGLFSVEQATGVATLNADAFNIAGLQEINLGTVTLGGSSATITEFSTDPFFTEDSDNIVPTQRAVKAYIASQIGGGGSSLNVNSVTAGVIFINSNQISTVTGETIKLTAPTEFRNTVTGTPLAFNYFLK